MPNTRSRPSFVSMLMFYPTGDAQQVFDLIGGKVKENNFSNSCAIRISRCLNYSGYPINFIPPNLTVSGADKLWYIYRVSDLITYLKSNYGDPDIVLNQKPFQGALLGKKGIIIFDVDIWSDASGHASLWNGSTCSDHCYFPISSRVLLWELK